jgi:hypothetical protein
MEVKAENPAQIGFKLTLARWQTNGGFRTWVDE